MKRTISKSDLEGFITRNRLFGIHGKGHNKSIDILVDPVEKRIWYEFTSCRSVIYHGPDLDEAIGYFNGE
jgi:hypothetical protein